MQEKSSDMTIHSVISVLVCSTPTYDSIFFLSITYFSLLSISVEGTSNKVSARISKLSIQEESLSAGPSMLLFSESFVFLTGSGTVARVEDIVITNSSRFG